MVFIPYAATLKAFGLAFERMRPHGGEAAPRSNYGVELSALGSVIKSALQDYLHLQRPLAL